MMWWIGLAVVVLILAGVLWRVRSRGKKIASLVLFLKTPRAIDAQAVRHAATKAYGVRMGADPEEENFVVQYTPQTMPVCIKGFPLGFICSDQPYTQQELSEEALAGFDVRIAKMLKEHKAWISVDLVGDVPASLKPEAYRLIARLLAEFVDDNCLGIFCPENDQAMYMHAGLKNQLRGENPLDAFEMADSPIVQASYDDPKLKATIDEAQRRWPEFVAAFARRRPLQNFGVKLKFEDRGECEFMWVAVESIDGDTIRGTLDNAPECVKNINSGDAVKAKLGDVLDWMYEDGKEMRGAFSLKVLSGE